MNLDFSATEADQASVVLVTDRPLDGIIGMESSISLLPGKWLERPGVIQQGLELLLICPSQVEGVPMSDRFSRLRNFFLIRRAFFGLFSDFLCRSQILSCVEKTPSFVMVAFEFLATRGILKVGGMTVTLVVNLQMRSADAW
jgi:hypothetical protein